MNNYYESVSNESQIFAVETAPQLQTQGYLGKEHQEYGICAKRLLVSGKCKNKNEINHHINFANSSLPTEESIIPEPDDDDDNDDDDDREPVRLVDSDTLPWRMICSLVASGNSRNSRNLVGTGWFAGPKTVVTAAHNVYDEIDLGGWARSITLYPGRYGSLIPYPKDLSFNKPIVSNKYKVLRGWLERDNSKKYNYDLAAIYLDDSVGEETGWFAFGVKSNGFIKDLKVNVSGYPVDQGGGKYQYFSKGVVDLNQSDKFRIFYTADTERGQSGGPVWFQDERNQPVVIGTHVYGVSRGFTLNSATRINSDIFEVIQQWISEA